MSYRDSTTTWHITRILTPTMAVEGQSYRSHDHLTFIMDVPTPCKIVFILIFMDNLLFRTVRYAGRQERWSNVATSAMLRGCSILKLWCSQLGQWWLEPVKVGIIMMTSSNGNFFCVTGPLCREFTGHQRIPLKKATYAELLMFSLICDWINGWVNNRKAGDLRRHRAHYDVTVMMGIWLYGHFLCLQVLYSQ